MPLPPSISTCRLRLALLFLVACPFALSIRGQSDPRVKFDLRTVSGTVTDPQHEPIRNAVVELENPANHEVISFITPADGHYIFQRLDSHTDFRIWATFRGHKSSIHTISMFDDHLAKTIQITIHPY